MTKTLRAICVGTALAFLATLALTGCREPGPAEEAGREIDEAVEEAGETMEELGEEAEEALEEIEDQID